MTIASNCLVETELARFHSACVALRAPFFSSGALRTFYMEFGIGCPESVVSVPYLLFAHIARKHMSMFASSRLHLLKTSWTKEKDQTKQSRTRTTLAVLYYGAER